MKNIGSYVAVLFLVTAYSVVIESHKRYVIKDSYKRYPDEDKTLNSYVELSKWLKKLIANENLKRNKEILNYIEELVAKLIKVRIKKQNAKRNLRNGLEIQHFLHKLNNFINENTQHNNYYEKRYDCHFGFRNPSHCKKQWFRRHALRKLKKEENKKEYTYALPMLVERAYSSSSSSSEEQQATRQKSRFQVVDNKHKKKKRDSSESEKSKEAPLSDDDRPVNGAKTSDSDETSNEYSGSIKSKQLLDSNEISTEKTVKPDSEESAKSSESSHTEFDGKYLYLQGKRLEKPSLRLGRFISRKLNERLPYFLPKRFLWDNGMMHYLDNYWENIKAHDTYTSKLEAIRQHL